jgi:cytochrome c biogenesis protein CcdA
MKMIFVILALIALVLTVFLGVGTGLGLILEWLWGMERSVAILTGVVALAFSTHLLIKFVRWTASEPEFKYPEVESDDFTIVSVRPVRSRKKKPKRS